MKIHRSRPFISMIWPRSAAGSVTITIVFSLPLERTLYLRTPGSCPGPDELTLTTTSKALAGKADLVGLGDDRPC